MRVKIQKKLLLLTIASIFVLSLVIPMTLAKVDPKLSSPDVIDMGLMPFTAFSVDITASNVEKLYGFEFVLTFDPDILMPMSYSAYYPFIEEWPSIIGFDYVSMAYAAGALNPDGLTTDVPVSIAKIDFVVLDYGVSALDLDDTTFSRITDLGAEAIYHVVSDGIFANVAVERSDLLGKSAWPEHHNWVRSKDSDLTLYARVKNFGTTTTIATLVKFKVRSEDGLWSKTFESNTEQIGPGQKRTLQKTITSFDLGPGTGKYYVSAQCYYDLDGDGIVDASGAKIKSFSFTVK